MLNCSNHIEMSSTELFFYIKNASVILFSNLNFTFRLINDCRDYMNDIILDSENKNFNSNLNFDINNILFQIICITLIHCIIFAQNHRYVCIYKNQKHFIMNLKTWTQMLFLYFQSQVHSQLKKNSFNVLKFL